MKEKSFSGPKIRVAKFKRNKYHERNESQQKKCLKWNQKQFFRIFKSFLLTEQIKETLEEAEITFSTFMTEVPII